AATGRGRADRCRNAPSGAARRAPRWHSAPRLPPFVNGPGLLRRRAERRIRGGRRVEGGEQILEEVGWHRRDPVMVAEHLISALLRGGPGEVRGGLVNHRGGALDAAFGIRAQPELETR